MQEPEFIGGDVDLRINIYRGQIEVNNAKINANGTKDGVNGAESSMTKEQEQVKKLLVAIEENPFATQAYYAEQIGVAKRTVSRMFVSLQEKGVLMQAGTRRKPRWVIRK